MNKGFYRCDDERYSSRPDRLLNHTAICNPGRSTSDRRGNRGLFELPVGCRCARSNSSATFSHCCTLSHEIGSKVDFDPGPSRYLTAAGAFFCSERTVRKPFGMAVTMRRLRAVSRCRHNATVYQPTGTPRVASKPFAILLLGMVGLVMKCDFHLVRLFVSGAGELLGTKRFAHCRRRVFPCLCRRSWRDRCAMFTRQMAHPWALIAEPDTP